MIIRNYILHPLWGVKRLSRIVASILRGYVVHVTYKSGKHIHIEHGVILDCPNIVLGDDITLYQNVRVFGKGTVKIGNHVVIGDSTIICASESVEIGSNTMIAGHCYITDCNHGTHQGELMRKQAMRCKPVFIGQNCWIGANCCLLPGTQIGSGVVIGAGSTISEVIPEESFVVPDRHYRIMPRI